MERRYLIWGAIVGVVATLVLVIPNHFSPREKIKSCFNQFQWQNILSETPDKVTATFFTGEDSTENSGTHEIKCSLSKLGFNAALFDEIASVGEGSSKHESHVIEWTTDSPCQGEHSTRQYCSWEKSLGNRIELKIFQLN